ncbi:MAG: peptide-methionine (S)-S-oxide reductase MsrA [Leptospiraceae bacterium]|nr:peptide-methionine (S)-S-oxide reductase MsrA [Leptospiraceae bacterium]
MAEKATVGGGCFWCLEAVYQRIKGVESVVSGYAGGTVPHPDYRSVCSGKTGHAEVIQITYDPSLLSFEQILEVFWASHDPTTLNRQGNDAGTQYRSIILTHDEAQEKAARASIQKWQSEFSDPIVTEITPLKEFYPAEDYHQDYFNQNPGNPYCIFVIQPKLKKLGMKASS